MATATPSAPTAGNVHQCKILVGWDEGGDWIDVTSPRGNTVTVHLRGKSLSVEESKFIDSLLEVSESVRPLTVEQMRLIKRLADMGQTPLPSQGPQKAPESHGQGGSYLPSLATPAPVLEPARAVPEAVTPVQAPVAPVAPPAPPAPVAVDPETTPPAPPADPVPSPEPAKVEVRNTPDANTTGVRYITLNYDIPEGAMANPSWLLWHYGFRRTKSDWVIPEARQPHQLYSAFEEYNANRAPGTKPIEWHIVRFDCGESEKIRSLARTILPREFVLIRQSLLETLESLQSKWEEMERNANGVQSKELDSAKAKKENATRAALRLAAEKLDALVQSADLFDMTEEVTPLMNAMREAIRTNALLHKVDMRPKRNRRRRRAW